jgi:rhamnosyl/mannosyltransferase
MMAALFLPKKIPIAVTWHSDVIRQKWALKLYLPILKYFMKRVKMVLVATPYHLESCPQLKGLKMDHLVQVVPMGIEPELWEETPEVQEETEKIRSQYPEKFLLLAVGRHIYYKGFEYLVTAMEKLPNCHLLLAGNGPLTNSYKHKLELAQIQDRVSFVGLISEEKLPSYYYACDTFCFPSVDKTEAYGYAQLEAMMCGRPVISTRLENGVNYLNLDKITGLIVPPKDVDALVQAVSLLQSSPEVLKKYGGQAKERALSEFTAEKMGARVLALFRKLAQG